MSIREQALLSLTSRLALAFGLSAFSVAPALAQPAQPAAPAAAASDDGSKRDVVVITGSNIKGAAKDATVPVAVITEEDLRLKGSPTPIELTKSLPFVTGFVNGENNFTNGLARNSTLVNVNLHGLSAGSSERTLVLFNEKRVAANNQQTDINTLPMAAVVRTEILKTGGSTAYGSDAEAGVVNFVTRKDLNGFDIGADYTLVDGSDGNWNGHINWGSKFDQGNILLSLGYNHTSELSTLERNWTRTSILFNPTQQWLNASNIGTYSVQAAQGGGGVTNVNFTDPGCNALGGYLSPLNNPQIGAPTCYISRIPFQNIVDEVDRYQLYGEVNYDLSENLSWHFDAFAGYTNNDHLSLAPQNQAVTNFPTFADLGANAGTQGRAAANTSIIGLGTAYYVPAANPGLRRLLQTYTAAQLGMTAAQYAYASANGVNSGSGWTPLNLGSEAAEGEIHFRNYRVSTGFDGRLDLFGGMDWSANVTWGKFEQTVAGASWDSITQNLQLALRGLGGPSCNVAANTPGANGCLWFNPFSNAYPSNPVTGVPNLTYGGTALENSQEVIDWFRDPNRQRADNELVTADFGVTGKVGFFTLPGGQIDYATGLQYRTVEYATRSIGTGNLAERPCTDAGIVLANCPVSNRGIPQAVGGLATGGGAFPFSGKVEALGQYLEFKVPVFDTLNFELGVRHEDSGPPDGSSVSVTTPRVSGKWQIFDFFALRAAREETFKAPTPLISNPNDAAGTSVNIGAGRINTLVLGTTSLRPEKTIAENVGAVFNFLDGSLTATVDAWSYELTDQFTSESAQNLFTAMFPANSSANCGTAAFADLQSRFTFNNGICGANNVSLIAVKNVNGPGLRTNGLDIDVAYTFPLFDGDVTLSTNTTRVYRLQQDDQYVFGNLILASYNQAGKLNTGIFSFAAPPIPKWRSEFAVGYQQDQHSLRLTGHFVQGVHDGRFDLAAGSAGNPLTPVPGFGTYFSNAGRDIKDTLIFDLGYGFTAEDWRFNATITNVLDKDPVFARYDMNYMATVGSPLGRTYRVSFSKQF